MTWYEDQGRLVHDFKINTDKKIEYCNFLINFMNDLGLNQKNVLKIDSGNVLDLVFVKCNKVKIEISLDNLLNIDFAHPVLNMQFEFKEIPKVSQIHYLEYEYCKYNFNRANFDLINDAINEVDWNLVLERLEIEEAV